MTEATWTNPGTSEDECQQAVKDDGSQIIGDTTGEDERRRFIALDQAVRISDSPTNAEDIIKDARAFEAYLKGTDNA